MWEWLLYGIFIATFLTYVGLVVGEGRGRINLLMLLAAIALFLIITTNLMMTFARVIVCFKGELISAAQCYDHQTTTFGTVTNFLYLVEAGIGDCIMIYRLFHVWDGNPLVYVVPCLSSVAMFASGIGIMYQFSVLPPGADIFDPVCARWVITFFVSTVVTNLYTTALITNCIWSNNRTLKSFLNSKLRLSVVITEVIVESIAIYTFTSLAVLVFYLTRSAWLYAFIKCTCPVIGLSFCMLLVRVRFHQLLASKRQPEPRGFVAEAPLNWPISAQLSESKSVLIDTMLSEAITTTQEETCTTKFGCDRPVSVDSLASKVSGTTALDDRDSCDRGRFYAERLP